jgi:multidrug efflux pump subunit AcrA (membrane-fusion protein)
MLAGWTPLVLMLATAWGGPAEEFGAERSQPRDAIESIRVENVFLVPSRQLDVPAREGGLITRLIVREGDHVRAGDLLGQLEEVTPQLVLRRADAELGRVRRESQNDLKLQIARKIEEVAGAELMRAEQS